MISKEKLLLDKIERTNRLHGLFVPGSRVVFGLSGGPDSSALTELLSALRQKYRLRLFCAHLNHGFSAQASAFERSARRTARRCDIPFYSHRVDVPALAKRLGLSPEEAGRNARYDFFTTLASRLRAGTVATAHTLDDQVETILFRIFRGTSLRGLSGIPYRRAAGRTWIVRPLLDCSRSDLLSYLRSKKIPFVTDRSNRSLKYRRNRIRHELIPLLERRLNPRVREAIVRLRQSFLDASPLLERAAERAWASCRVKRGKGGALTLDRRAFSKLAAGLKQELFLRAADSLGVGRKAMTRLHAEAALPALRTGQILDHLPGVTVTVGARRISFYQKSAH